MNELVLFLRRAHDVFYLNFGDKVFTLSHTAGESIFIFNSLYNFYIYLPDK